MLNYSCFRKFRIQLQKWTGNTSNTNEYNTMTITKQTTKYNQSNQNGV